MKTKLKEFYRNMPANVIYSLLASLILNWGGALITKIKPGVKIMFADASTLLFINAGIFTIASLLLLFAYGKALTKSKELETELGELRKKNNNLREEITSLVRKQILNESQNEKVKSEFDKLRESLTIKCDSLCEENKSLLEKNESLSFEINKLHEENKSLREEINALLRKQIFNESQLMKEIEYDATRPLKNWRIV